MNARQLTVRGEKMWCVALGKREIGKRVRVFGGTKREAEERAQAKLDELREHGRDLADISAAHRGLILDWRDKLSVEQMTAAFRRFAAGAPTSRRVDAAVTEYLAARSAGFSRQHASSLRTRFKKFSAAFTGQLLDALNPGALETFIANQGASEKNYFSALRAFFAHARRHRWTLTDPMAEVPRPSGNGDGEKEIFKPAQMHALLRTAAGLDDPDTRHEPTLALLVLGGLCGLRYTEALRLDWRQVDLAGGEIHLDKLKTSKRGLRSRFVKILPAAASWLTTIERADSGRVVKVNDANARRQRARILRAARVKAWPHNVLRRSWGSYHLAAFETADLTAAQMGHTSADTTFAKYRTLARKVDGEAWFALSASAVAGVENVVPFAVAQ